MPMQSVEGEHHEKAVELLKAAQGSVKLVVRYTPKVLEEMEARFEKMRSARRRQQHTSYSWGCTQSPLLIKYRQTLYPNPDYIFTLYIMYCILTITVYIHYLVYRKSTNFNFILTGNDAGKKVTQSKTAKCFFSLSGPVRGFLYSLSLPASLITDYINIRWKWECVLTL